MKKTALLLAAAWAIPMLWATPACADMAAGISLDQDGVKGFYLAVGEYYRAPESEVAEVRAKHISDDELPVVLFIAARARVAPGVIIDLRLGGRTWAEVSAHFNIGPEVYYVPLARDPGPPYGRAYGFYKNHSKRDWGTIQLSDADVVNLVNLRFAADHYGIAPDEVVGMRAKGQSFVSVHDNARHARKQKNEARLAADDKQSGGPPQGKGKKK